MKTLISLFVVVFIKLFYPSTRLINKHSGWNLEQVKHEFNRIASDDLVLGINSFFHDSSASFVRGSQILWSAQEERFNRIKNTNIFPEKSILFGLKHINSEITDVRKIVYFENPKLKFERILNQIRGTNLGNGVKIVSQNFNRLTRYHLLFRFTLFRKLKQLGLTSKDLKEKLSYSNHHLSHAISAFKPSPFQDATVVVVDAVGEMESISIWDASNSEITKIASVSFPDSLGMFYSAFTHYCGFNVNSGEYKMMGLAPFGEPNLKNKIMDEVIKLNQDGSIQINEKYLTYGFSNEMYSESELFKLLGFKKRSPETKISQDYMDLAASVQQILNEAMLNICHFAKKLSGSNNLVLAGGVALNCVSNGLIHESRIFKNVWVQPAAGDAGTSLGAAMIFNPKFLSKISIKNDDEMQGSFLGNSYSNEEIYEILCNSGLRFKLLDNDELINEATKSIINFRVIGWFQGRMEFGPRSLGARSILANSTDPEGQKKINLKIKFRESFRPFAPLMLQQSALKYFIDPKMDKYMLFVSKLKNEYRIKQNKNGSIEEVNLIRSEFPSITHLDYSARIQVADDSSPVYKLLENLLVAGLPIIVNTSFNVRGEPIVESPLDAINCFMTTDLDDLYIGNYYLKKEDQPLNKSRFVSRVIVD